MSRSDHSSWKDLLDRLAFALIETIAATLSAFAIAADRACEKVSLHGLEESEEQDLTKPHENPPACESLSVECHEGAALPVSIPE
jgi:hypothetical protein